MKIYSGKQKIGQYFNIDLMIDFNDLFHYKGERKLVLGIDKILGRILLLLGFVMLLGPVLYDFIRGTLQFEKFLNPDSFINLVPCLSVYIILYAFYLLRNKNEFGFNTEVLNLKKIKDAIAFEKIKSIEIDNYFSEEALSVIDGAYFKDPNQFLQTIAESLLKNKRNIYILRERLAIDSAKFNEHVNVLNKTGDLTFDNNFAMFFLRCFSTAIEMDVEYIDVQILFLIMCKYYWKRALLDSDASEVEIEGIMAWLKNERRKEYYYHLWKSLSRLKPRGPINRSFTSRVTPVLDTYGVDFTSLAANKDFVTAIGKDEVLMQIFKSLQKKNGAATLIVGDPGVGKTHLLKYLATRMVVEDVPASLVDLRLVVVDLNKVMAKAASIDNFKSLLQSMLEEIVKAGNTIICFEEIGQMFGLRDEGRSEVINLISNMIDKHKLKVVGTTNREDYIRRMKPVKGFVALFEVIEVPEPPQNISFQIVMDAVPDLEKLYGIQVRSEAVKRIVEFGADVMHDRVMPDKGIALLEEAILSAKAKRLTFLDETSIDELLKSKTGVSIGNISENEAKVLTNLENEMHKRVIGQDMAVAGIARALRRARSGMASGKRPIASFLFYGPTGVGKTEVAKTLADVYYGDDKLMVRVDMSEYQEELNLGRLIGYSDEDGNFLGGYLTEAVRSKPFSLVLLDEIEKANPKVLDLFLQVLDEGHLKDGMGRDIDFTHTIIIATSNAGSRQIAELILKGQKYYDVQKQVEPILREVFRIEFLNRYDDVIMFKPLNKVEIEQIANIMMQEVGKKLEEKGIILKWDKRTLELLSDMGYNAIYGARELRRVVQDVIEDKIANILISKKAISGNEIIFAGLEIVSINR